MLLLLIALIEMFIVRKQKRQNHRNTVERGNKNTISTRNEFLSTCNYALLYVIMCLCPKQFILMSTLSRWASRFPRYKYLYLPTLRLEPESLYKHVQYTQLITVETPHNQSLSKNCVITIPKSYHLSLTLNLQLFYHGTI